MTHQRAFLNHGEHVGNEEISECWEASRSDLAARAAVPLVVIHDFGLNVAFLSRLA
jgi:hypothetical protein